MEASELRTGTYVITLATKEIAIIHSVVSEAYKSHSGIEDDLILKYVVDTIPYFGLDMEDVEPISLTEEWMVKFGFKSNNQTDGFWFPQTNIWVRLQKGRFSAHLQHDKLTNLEYVHQLQNLYFALTGEELTIKE